MKLAAVAIALAASLGLASASPLQLLDERQTTNTTCPKYRIVTARGTTVPQGLFVGYEDMIAQVRKAVPGGAVHDLIYPADTDFETSVPNGIAGLTRYLNRQIKVCPKQKLVLIGYSQGAEVIDAVTQNVLPTKNATIVNAIKAIVLIGDPNHTPYNSANVDSKGGKSTTKYTGIALSGKLTPIPLAYNKAGKLLNICRWQDSVCASDQPGANFEAHLQYIGAPEVQSLGANYIIPRIK